MVIQFFRYVLVGGIAFVADFSTLSLVYQVLLQGVRYGLLIGTAAGFVVGSVVNYCVSKKWVFAQNASRAQNPVLDFILYVFIGFLGLLLTEFGMHLGVQVWMCNYAATKVVVAGIVLLWNFLARRFCVYKVR